MTSTKSKFTRVKRIVQELKELEKNTTYDIYLEEANEFDTVRVVMPGPTESLYEGGFYVIRIHFGPEYPYKSPSVGILNKIYHPNVDWGSGSVCFNALNHDWKECYTLFQMVTTLMPFLLRTPNGSDPLNQEAGLLCEKCPDQYTQIVKEMVGKHALLSQLEPILKGMYDWRMKQPYHPSHSSLVKSMSNTTISTTTTTTTTTAAANTNAKPSSSAQSAKKEDTKSNMAANAKMAGSKKLSQKALGARRGEEEEANHSDSIDDNALLDSSDSEREENKQKKEKRNIKNEAQTPSSGQDSATMKSAAFLHKPMGITTASGETKDNAGEVTKQLEALSIGTHDSPLHPSGGRHSNSNNIWNKNDDRGEEKMTASTLESESGIQLPPPINIQKFNQWWSRSSSSASLSSFEMLRRSKSEMFEPKDTLKREKRKSLEDTTEADFGLGAKRERVGGGKGRRDDGNGNGNGNDNDNDNDDDDGGDDGGNGGDGGDGDGDDDEKGKSENVKSMKRATKMSHYLLASKSACNSPQLNSPVFVRDQSLTRTSTQTRVQTQTPNLTSIHTQNRGKSVLKKSTSKEASTKTKGNKLLDKIRLNYKPPPPSYPRPKYLDDKDRKQTPGPEKMKTDELIEKEQERKKDEWSDFRNSEDDDNDLSSLDEDPVSCIERHKEMETLMNTSSYSRPYFSSERSISPFLTPMHAPLHRREQTEMHLSMTPQPPLPDRYESVLHSTLPTKKNHHNIHGSYAMNTAYVAGDHFRHNSAGLQTWTRRTANHKQIDQRSSPVVTVITKKT